MASSMIHIAVANEVNKTLKRNNKHILIGSIAPDIAKHIGIAKKNSHFQDTDADLPHLEEFLNKYKDKLNDDFVLGYYIHLYTDYLWFKYFEPDFYKNGVIYKLDGSEEYVPAEQKRDYFYNDYTNLNIKLSRTEYAGLGAGLLNSSLVTGFTFISMLFISNIFLAKSYQLH